ncbi:MAG: argininosuccinate lyase, partial [Terriglobales bacterium]
MEKLWSGRFREPLDAQFEQWQRSFPFDVRLLPDELAASRAWARALAKSGVFTAAELDSVVKALDAIGAKAAPNPADF